MRTRVGVMAMLALTILGTLAWGGEITQLWARTFTGPCPGGPEPDCVATAEATVTDRWDNIGEDETQLTLTGSSVSLTFRDAEELGATVDDEVRVTLIGERVFAIELDGRTVSTEYPAVTAILKFLLVAAGAIVVVVLVGRLRWREGWATRAAACTAVGALAGVAVAAATGPAWVAPALFVVPPVVAVAASFARLPRAWSPAAAQAEHSDRCDPAGTAAPLT
jgi:hypothetical protein